MIPAWLQPILEARGAWNGDGVSRRAHAITCRCGQTVIRGLDADRAALPISADPQPLNQLGEVLTLTTGRHTYDLEWRNGRYELNPRRAAHIANSPPNSSPDTSVVAEHQCGRSAPALEMQSQANRPVNAEKVNAECPY